MRSFPYTRIGTNARKIVFYDLAKEVPPILWDVVVENVSTVTCRYLDTLESYVREELRP